jgi:predicted dehydrogenase
MLRAVMAGCGAMSKGWLRSIEATPELASSVTVVGLVDLDEARAKALAAEFGLSGATIGSDLEIVLAATKPDLLFDIVVPPARAGVVETGLRHSCHVLSEKPLATSLAEANRLIEAARSAGRIHAVVQNRRYIEGVRRLRRAVAEGLIGDVTAIHCDFFIGAHFGGFREQMEHVLLLDMAIHTFDAARFVIGSAPSAVYCHESNPPGSWYQHGAAANAIFEFDGGAVFVYRGSWCAEGANTSWESSWRVIGSKGTILWDGADDFRVGLTGQGTSLLRDPMRADLPPPADEKQTHGHASVISEFVAAVRSGRAPETVATDNIKSLAMVLAAIESAQRRQRVVIATKDQIS